MTTGIDVRANTGAALRAALAGDPAALEALAARAAPPAVVQAFWSRGPASDGEVHVWAVVSVRRAIGARSSLEATLVARVEARYRAGRPAGLGNDQGHGCAEGGAFGAPSSRGDTASSRR